MALATVARLLREALRHNARVSFRGDEGGGKRLSFLYVAISPPQVDAVYVLLR